MPKVVYKSDRSFRVPCTDGIVRLIQAATVKMHVSVGSGWPASGGSPSVEVSSNFNSWKGADKRALFFTTLAFPALLPNADTKMCFKIPDPHDVADATLRDVPLCLADLEVPLSDGSTWHVPAGDHLVWIRADPTRMYLRARLTVIGHGSIEVHHPWAPIIWTPISSPPGSQAIGGDAVGFYEPLTANGRYSAADRTDDPLIYTEER